MKNKNLSFYFFLLTLLWITSCTSIPKIQDQIEVEKIYTTKIEANNGKTFKTVSKKSSSSTTIILVRHAEKMKDSNDPNLTQEGLKRAEKLKNILASLPLDEVYSTVYNRTLQTATPSAKAQSLEVRDYDPRALKEFSQSVLKNHEGENILIVGHSNTTPNLLNFFMEEKVVDSIDESDYGNIYIINIENGNQGKVVLGRF